MKGIKLILSKIDYGRKLLVMFMSLLVIGAIVVDYGFVLDASEMALIHRYMPSDGGHISFHLPFS